MSDEDRIEDKTTEANYEKWHDRLEERTQEGYVPRRAVLISEILGDVDGPHEREWK